MKIELRNGDCLEELKKLAENSVDSIVTDPPYELGFMGKKWDNTGIAYNVDLWRECLRVLKPGGHLLSFGGTRTYHRMAVAIEDAGFEIRDMIEWVYGSGFPKSHNIGKAVDKLQGNEREDLGEHPTINGKGDHFAFCANYNGARLTKGTSEFEGFGTNLKPAHEPICMARKPISEKTVAENCLKWKTGGINIDESRVGIDKSDDIYAKNPHTIHKGGNNIHFTSANPNVVYKVPKGRFPANLIHDGSEEVRECFPETKSGGYQKGSVLNTKKKSDGFLGWKNTENGFSQLPLDSGNASRFFKSIIYQPKPSKKERNEGCEGLVDVEKHGHYAQDKWSRENMGNTPDAKRKPTKNNHPTVKPTALMEYLITMITPKRGVVLDPFMGSGTTGRAAKKLGFSFIGIELEEEYYKIAEKRINFVENQINLQ